MFRLVSFFATAQEATRQRMGRIRSDMGFIQRYLYTKGAKIIEEEKSKDKEMTEFVPQANSRIRD